MADHQIESTSAEDWLWLRVIVEAPGRAPRPVGLRLSPDTSIRTLSDAIAQHLDLKGTGAHLLLHSKRLNRVLDETSTVADVGLLAGDWLSLGGPTSSSSALIGERAAAVDLVVVGGPAIGTRHPLQHGHQSVGRGDNATVRIDDPLLSRVHLEVWIDGDSIVIEDAGSSNGTFIDRTRVRGRKSVEIGRVIEMGSSLVEFQASPAVESDERNGGGIRKSGPYTAMVEFNRPPRVVPTQPASRWSVGAPPGHSSTRRFPLSTALAPLLLGLVLFLFLRRSGDQAGNSPLLMMSLAMMALSPVIAVWSFIEDRRGGKKQFGKEVIAWREELARLEADVSRRLEEKSERIRAVSPGADELLDRARRLDPRLWERRPRDDDFLSVRVGWGDQPSGLELDLEPGGEKSLRAEVEPLVDRYSLAASVPMQVSLPEVGVLGLGGPRAAVNGLGRWLIAQIATLHSPEDVRVAAAISNEAVADWQWLSWLAHCNPEAGGNSNLLAASAEQTQTLFDWLATIVEERREQNRQFRASSLQFSPRFVVVVDEAAKLPRRATDVLLTEGPAVGVHLIWLGSAIPNLPGECGAVVEVETDGNSLVLTYPSDDRRLTGTPDLLVVELCDELGMALAPVVDSRAREGKGVLPRRVSLLDLIGMRVPKATAVARRWQDTSNLGCVVGASEEGQFRLDLRRDGPHGLVGGTTGSGKSELLQSIVASLASSYSPDRLNFILVDYKGGAAFKDCVRLPHTVGFVTDLDGHLVRRALTSLNAELRRREGLLHRAGARDVIEMERRSSMEAFPNLLIVVDEFATLVKELPEFVDGVVDVAQRGRSLGVHLLLATQRPAGVINDNLRANTNLRIALRVSDEVDSQDVIGTRDAARIPRSLPGRAFVRTGDKELTEIQSAYVGGQTRLPGTQEEVQVVPLSSTGVRVAAESSGTAETVGRSDLQVLVETIEEAAAGLNLAPPHRPWLPPLPEVVSLTPGSPTASSAIIGVIDQPDQQSQSPFHLDLDRDGSILIYGASGSGKTTLLRTAATSLALQFTPDEINLCGLDFATRGLMALEALPHCGSIVPGEDIERATRVFDLIRKEIARRKDLFGTRGVSSFEEYARQSAEIGVPRMVILLDGYGGFSSVFDQIDFGQMLQDLPRLVADAMPMGIHFLISSDRRGAVPMALTSVVSRRIVLRMADADEYADLGIDSRIVRRADLPPGRGFTGSSLEIQACIVGEDPSGEAQTAEIRRIGADLRARYPKATVPKIGRVPNIVSADDLPVPTNPMRPYVGIGGDNLQPVAIPLDDAHFLIAGPHRSGRTTALATIAGSILCAKGPPKLFLLSPRRSFLTSLDSWEEAAIGEEACLHLASRLEVLAREREPAGTHEPVVIFVDDGEELSGTPADAALEFIARRGRDTNIRIVGAAENQAALRAYAGWLPEVRKERQGILLVPDHEVDGDIVGTRLPRRPNRSAVPMGRGYVVVNGHVGVLQAAKADL